MDTSLHLFLLVLLSSFGMAYMVYGKRQAKFVPAIAGLGLMAYPYFIQRTVPFLLVGAALVALPFVVRE